MGIEDRILELENTTKILTEKIEYVEKLKHDQWVSAKELSEIMGCSVNNIYIKIRKGEIFATDKLGSIPRIPMSQFYDNENPKVKNIKQFKKEALSMKERVFGVG